MKVATKTVLALCGICAALAVAQDFRLSPQQRAAYTAVMSGLTLPDSLPPLSPPPQLGTGNNERRVQRSMNTADASYNRFLAITLYAARTHSELPKTRRSRTQKTNALHRAVNNYRRSAELAASLGMPEMAARAYHMAGRCYYDMIDALAKWRAMQFGNTNDFGRIWALNKDYDEHYDSAVAHFGQSIRQNAGGEAANLSRQAMMEMTFRNGWSREEIIPPTVQAFEEETRNPTRFYEQNQKGRREIIEEAPAKAVFVYSGGLDLASDFDIVDCPWLDLIKQRLASLQKF